MNEQRTVVPQPTPSPPTAAATDVPGRLPHPVALFVAAATVGTVAALAVGSGVGVLVVAAGTSDCSPSDGWCALGATVVGVLIGVATGTIAYIVGGVMTIMRCRPASARGRYVVAHLLLPVIAIATASAFGAVLG